MFAESRPQPAAIVAGAMTKSNPYGSWASPISAQMVAQAGIRFSDSIEADGPDIYWVETRPLEQGRSVIVRLVEAGIEDVTPAGFNARTRVHEYGGGAYAVDNGEVLFANFADQRLYRHRPGEPPSPITPEPALEAGDRYADMCCADDFIICVRERHSADAEPVNELVRLPRDGSAEPEVIASGHDFYASPMLSPDGQQLAWLTWDHPNMPWNGTHLWVAEMQADGSLAEPALVAGGTEESVFQPEWSPGGQLYFCSDRTGWWNLYRHHRGQTVPVAPAEADTGLPQWTFRRRCYVFTSARSVVAIQQSCDGARILVHGPDGTNEIPSPGPSLAYTIAATDKHVVVIAGGPDRMPALTRLDAATGAAEVIHTPAEITIDSSYLSLPEHMVFDTPDGAAHAFCYPPANPDYQAPPAELPPLVLFNHGGPTSSTSLALNPMIQFWTSRGFAVVDVDYGGSTGYGRAYWERLHLRWGIVDIRDCELAARHLVNTGQADPERLAIRGGSAGGYTTLGALAFTDTFAVGASYFGVADLALLTKDTHKFESHYLDWLVGPYPEEEDVYKERSPIDHADQIACPVILFQGLEDRVVPPEQAEIMAETLRRNGIPVAHITFEGEGHGFRRAENIIRSLEAELSFYCQVFGIEPAGDVEPVRIEGL
jgi:dipeptidyl aminopeptidase/acylaminoacyl peptidase